MAFLKAEKNRKTVINTKSRQIGRGLFGGVSSYIIVIKCTYIFAQKAFLKGLANKGDET